MKWNDIVVKPWDTVGTITYRGIISDITSVTNPCNGDICEANGYTYIYGGSSWQALGYIKDLNNHEPDEFKVEYRTNCPNCGAPMRNHICEYCGTIDYGKKLNI